MLYVVLYILCTSLEGKKTYPGFAKKKAAIKRRAAAAGAQIDGEGTRRKISFVNHNIKNYNQGPRVQRHSQ